MKRSSLAVLILLVFVLSTSAKVHAGAGGYATEYTQLLNHVELINQYEEEVKQTLNQVVMIENQLNQYANMLTNTQGFPNEIWGNAVQDLQLLQQAVAKGQALAYTFSNIDQAFGQRFKGYGYYSSANMSSGDISAKYNQWSQQTLDTCRSALSAANLQYQDFTTEHGTMQQLENASQSATGRMQALQVGNQIAGQLVAQMQKLRQLTMTQIELQSQYVATLSEEKAMDQAEREKFYQAPVLPLGAGKGYGPDDMH